MNHSLSYAMRNEEATNSLIYFNNPFNLLDWSHTVIEAMMITGFILACIHAYKTMKKTGSISAPLTLLCCLTYGLTIDVLSYYTVESFWHGEFSVMFLNNKLPLYIACFYPAYMYHNYMLIHRYKFPVLVEAIALGFFDGLMYLIFDNFGPMVDWWVWDRANPTNQPFLNNVPLTSYHWFFTFTIAFSLVNRKICWDLVEGGVKNVKLFALGLLAQPIMTIMLGLVLFIPYNLLAKNSLPYTLLPWEANLHISAAIAGLAFFVAGWIFFINWRRPTAPKDNLLLAFPYIYLMGMAYMYVAKFDLFMDVTNGISNVNNMPIGNLIYVLLAFGGSTFIILMSQLSSNQSNYADSKA